MSKKLWGGRFKKKIDKDFFQFQKSIHFDCKLARYDIYHSLIHVGALAEAGLITKDEEQKIVAVLRGILADIEHNRYKPDLKAEDVHTDIQNKLAKRAGNLALKLHTLRSRNDQIVYDEKMYCLAQYVEVGRLLTELLEVLSRKFEEYSKEFFIGYTHMRRAQVVYFGDYILAYAQMFSRDYQRLTRFEEDLKIFIGAGALAGSPLLPQYYRRNISISGVIQKHFEELSSAMDNVSDRDYLVEFLSILSIIQMHLSRFAEDLILYSTKEFNFIDLPEEFCTGSSLMPHKKNPDFLELVRGYSGILYGNLMAVLTIMKGQPLTYNRDMQLEKEPLFSSVEVIKQQLAIMSPFVKGLKLKKENISLALNDETLYATELVQFLVYRGAAFKDAHDVVGKLVRFAEDNNRLIKTMDDKTLKSFHPELNQADIKKIMDPHYAVSSKKSVSRKFPKIKKTK